MNIQLSLALRYLSGRKLRTVLTTLAIVFGVVVIFGMNSMLPAFTNAFQANIMAAAGQVDATITLKTSDVFDAGVTAEVAAVEGVRVVSGYLNRGVNLPVDYYDKDPAVADTVTGLSLVGIVPDQARGLHPYQIKAGRFLTVEDGAAAVISQSLADMLGLQVDDILTMPGAGGEAALTVVGIMPARAMPGNEEVLVPLQQAQVMLDQPGKINTIEANFEPVDDARRTEITNTIVSTLGDMYQVGALQSNSELLTNMMLAQSIFNVLGILALLMGGFIIFNTFRTIVAERRRDIGLLRALGANRATILGIILTEGVIQGIVGTLVGLLAGYGLALGIIGLINPLMQGFMNLKIGAPAISLELVAFSMVMGIGVTLLAGLLPAVNASRVTPIEALRPSIGAVTLKRIAGIGFWAGAAMIALAVAALVTRNSALIGLGGVLFVVGLILVAPALVNPIANLFGALLSVVIARSGTGQLAEGNLSRQPGRAAITASTTLIAMSILIMAMSMFSSVQVGFGKVLRKSLGSDYLLVPPAVAVWGSNVGTGRELVDALRAVDGVEVVSTLRYAPTQTQDVAVAVMGIDPQAYPKVSGLAFTAGDESTAYASLGQGRAAIVNGVLATTAGVGVGEEIELNTPSGKQSYQVVAIAGDYLNSKIATAYLSQANLSADFNRDEDVLVQINVSPQVDRAAVEGAFNAILMAYPQYRLIDGQEFIEENLAIFQQAFVGIYALVIFLAVPSLIAMVNTLAIGVIERTREIGMLRAVGATRLQVRTIIVAEALILAGIGTGFGILSGLYLGYMAVEAMRAAGFPMEYVFPASGVLIAISSGIFFGILAALIPARQAARLEIVQALRYE